MNDLYYQNIQICAGILKKEYLQAVHNRNGKSIKGNWIFNGDVNKLVDQVAKELKDIRLAKLFIEAQFAGMPSVWCRSTFKKPYPPVKVVFNSGCWLRYESYIADGVRQPV